MMADKSRCAGEKNFHCQLSVYYGWLPLPQRAPVPPIPLLLRKVWIAGLGDCAVENIQAADVVPFPCSPAEPVI
jgi:hypothetical protein